VTKTAGTSTISATTAAAILRDRHLALRSLRSLLPLTHSEADEVFTRVDDTITATVFGSLVVAFAQGCMGGLIFWWLGLPSPLLWGAVMGVLAVIPVLGTFVIWMPTAMALALQGEWTKAAILATWGALAIGLIDNLLYPFIVGKRMRFHTLLVFIAVVGGIALFGASGIVLGPVVLAVADALLDIWRRRTAESSVPEPASIP
jgi:predicted PurR-regulated permease PerM